MSTENTDPPFGSVPPSADQPMTSPPAPPIMPPPMTAPVMSQPVMSQPFAAEPATMPPTIPSMPLTMTHPPYTPYGAYAPIPPVSPAPQGRRGMGNSLRVLAVVVATLIVIGIAAGSMPASVVRARTIAYPRPSIDISMPQSSGPSRVGDSLLFVAQAKAGTDLSFSWDFGDGSFGAGPRVDHTYADYGNGAYTVTLNANDPIGQHATSELTVNVLPAQPHAAFTANASSDNPFDVQFDGTASTGTQLSCTWDFGDGTTDTSGYCQSEHQFQQLGSFDVKLTVEDIARQTDTTSQSVMISIPKPTASFSVQTDGFGCVYVDASNSSGYQLTYSWDFGDGYTDNATYSSTDSHCYSSPGTYTITLTVTDAGGQNDTTRQQASV